MDDAGVVTLDAPASSSDLGSATVGDWKDKAGNVPAGS